MNKSQPETKRLMEHPVFLMHDANAKIIRAQLFFLSLVTILLTNSSIKIGEKSTVLGISLEGLTTAHIFNILLFLLSYQVIHFSWASVESFYEWRARLTALDAGGFGGGVKISAEDQGTKIRQTTLYSYITYVLNSDLKKLREQVINQPTENDSQRQKEIDTTLQRIFDALNNSRISDALWRFDNWFKMFCKLQNVRWAVLEFFLPATLGVFAIYCSIKAIYFCV